MHTRSGGTQVYETHYRSRIPTEWAVQVVERMDIRPEARHYGPRFTDIARGRRATMEKIMLNMRTDGHKVRMIGR